MQYWTEKYPCTVCGATSNTTHLPICRNVAMFDKDGRAIPARPRNIYRGIARAPLDLAEIDRNARAYGFEIGRGRPMTEAVETSEDNPFLDPNWSDKMIKED